MYCRHISVNAHVYDLECDLVGGAQRGAGRPAAGHGAEDRGGEGARVGRHAGGLPRRGHAVVGGKHDEARGLDAGAEGALQRAQPHRPLLQQAQRACVSRQAGRGCRVAALLEARTKAGGGQAGAVEDTPARSTDHTVPGGFAFASMACWARSSHSWCSLPAGLAAASPASGGMAKNLIECDTQ